MTDPVRQAAVVGLHAGRYRLGAVLGRGSMADVWRGEDSVLGRPVAIKLFRSDVAAAADPRRRSGEIRVLAALNHPGLVTLFDAGTEADPVGLERPYLIMELVDGPSLSARLADGPLPPAEAAALGAELADTLTYVHAQAVVHRDLKPANILLETRPDGSCAPRLADFGIARLVDGTRLTQAGITVGTANYLSPEQALGQDVDSASDVYALGLVLLECLTGRTEFPGVGVAAAAARLHRDPVIPQAVPPNWRALLAAMIARDPSARPTAAQAAAGLRALCGDPDATVSLPVMPAASAGTTTLPAASAGTTALPTRLAAAPRRPRNLAVLVLGAVAAAAVAGLVAVLVTMPSGAGSPAPSAPPATTPSTTTGTAVPAEGTLSPARTTPQRRPETTHVATHPANGHGNGNGDDQGDG